MSVLVIDTPITKSPLRKMFRPHRILIMKLLERKGKEGIAFQQLKAFLNLTDGNLASHLKSLEDDEYITFEKISIGHKTTTIYKLTPHGEEILKKFTNELLNILKS
jgi:DNA-binding MarR family transcriptional regulator